MNQLMDENFNTDDSSNIEQVPKNNLFRKLWQYGSVVALASAVSFGAYDYFTNASNTNKNSNIKDYYPFLNSFYQENIVVDGAISRGYGLANKLETSYLRIHKTYIDGIDERTVYDKNYYLGMLEEVTIRLGKDSTTYYSSDIKLYTKRGQELKTMFEQWNQEYNDTRRHFALTNPKLFPGLNNPGVEDAPKRFTYNKK